MATKKIKCRDHGGYFTVEARRGRPPVRCTEDNKCDAQTVAAPTKARTAPTSQGVRRMHPQGAQSMTRTLGAPTARSTASVPASQSATWVEAKAATTKEINRIFRELTVQGWAAKRGWLTDNDAEITATRGEEMLFIVVQAGHVTMQQYSLWAIDKPSMNGKPNHNLPFDPDEIGDGELARALVGNRVTWFNRLSGKEERGVCGRDSIKIEHGYSATGDEIPGERIIKFVDPDRKQFVAFRLDALLKVGK